MQAGCGVSCLPTPTTDDASLLQRPLLFYHNTSRGVPASKMWPASSSNRPRTELISLPTELHLEILDHLSPWDRALFRLTNRHFITLIPRPTREDLLQIEKTPKLKGNYLTCNCCAKLLPKSCFQPPVLEPGNMFAGIRFCLECGFNPEPTPGCCMYSRRLARSDKYSYAHVQCCHRYLPGDRPMVDGRLLMLCERCHKKKRWHPTCAAHRDYWLNGRLVRSTGTCEDETTVCEDCWTEEDEVLRSLSDIDIDA